MMTFSLGQIVATPGALAALVACGIPAATLLRRHATGDWGDLDAHDRAANAQALRTGARLLSAYRLTDDIKMWIITEAADDDGSRAATTLLLPDEY